MICMGMVPSGLTRILPYSSKVTLARTMFLALAFIWMRVRRSAMARRMEMRMMTAHMTEMAN
jgi:hypothetical protein